jgi:DDE superfamily endonuclease
MMIVLPDGYIIEADGMYYADFKNDARILNKMLKVEEGGIMSILNPNDVCLLDRGFRDSL